MNTQRRSLYLVRHGETEWNALGKLQGSKDSPLTSKGRAQAASVAQFFAEIKQLSLFTSPLGRALETARIISKTLLLDPIVIPEFAETAHGDFEGRTKSELEETYPEFWRERERSKQSKLTICYPGGGESYLHVLERTAPTLESILASSPSSIVIVGHEGVNRMLRGHTRQLPHEEMVDLRQPNNVVVEISLTTKEETVHTL